MFTALSLVDVETILQALAEIEIYWFGMSLMKSAAIWGYARDTKMQF
jgi:hypothetical protein